MYVDLITAKYIKFTFEIPCLRRVIRGMFRVCLSLKTTNFLCIFQEGASDTLRAPSV